MSEKIFDLVKLLVWLAVVVAAALSENLFGVSFNHTQQVFMTWSVIIFSIAMLMI